jgi:hypothetical protein
MTDLHKEQAELRYFIDGKVCQYCGKALINLGDGCAHRIPQKKYLIKKYKEKIIHHNFNLVPTCSKHNSKYLIEFNLNKLDILLNLIENRNDEFLTTKEINQLLEK